MEFYIFHTIPFIVKSLYSHFFISQTLVSGRTLLYQVIYSRLLLSRNRRDPLKHFEISVLQHIRFVVLRKKQFKQPNFTNDYVI